MQDLFFQSFIHNILLDNFLPAEYLKLGEYNCYFKKENDIIYFILPLVLDDISKDKIEHLNEVINKYELFFELNKNKLNCNKIVFLRLFIFSTYEKEVFNYIKNKFDINSEVLHVDWIVDLKNEYILARKNHITKILNLQEIIVTSFNLNKNQINYDNKYTQNLTETKIINKNNNLTLGLILVNFIVYIYINLINKQEFYFWIMDLAITPEIFYESEFYRLFTSMFLHFNFKHLLSNCLSLYIFGSLVEKCMGKVKFTIYYILGGVMAGISSVLFTRGISIGASGAIFAIEGALLYYSFKEKRNLEQFDFYSIFIILLVGISMGFLQNNVDNAGHIGGLLSGFMLSFVLYRLNLKK